MKSIIIYTTKYGSVEKAAKLLKPKLNGQVDLLNLAKEKAPNLDGYDNVILGGSIYAGKVQKKLSDYITQNLPLLLKKRVGLFICAGQPEPVGTQELQSSFPPELVTAAAVKEVFGYEYNLEKLNFIDKLAIRVIAKVKTSKFALSEETIDRFARTMNA